MSSIGVVLGRDRVTVADARLAPPSPSVTAALETDTVMFSVALDDDPVPPHAVKKERAKQHERVIRKGSSLKHPTLLAIKLATCSGYALNI